VLGSGLGEINRPLVGRARIVQLWHGAPFKRIHADFPDGDNVLPGRSPVARAVNAAVRWTANRTRSQVAMVPSQSAVVAERFQSAFGIDAGRTPVLGTPRADIIGATGPAPDAEAAALRSALLGERADVARLVLYAPTWRDGGDESFLAAGLDGTALDAVLARHDAAMVIRTHPQGERGQFDAAAAGASRVLVDHGTAPVDVNVLLRAVDLLLTDYSAISVDYALLRRPIVYFMPDLADYERSRGLYEPPSAMTGGRHCRSWDEVIAALDACFTDPEPYLAPVDEVRARYWGHLDTRSCERIARAIATGAPAAGILA
jgi:CDP-glycerol glycerophosphotransferase (TagB/SpsB family)